MAGTMHGADAVRKTHNHACETFGSPNARPLGAVAGGRIHVHGERRPLKLLESARRLMDRRTVVALTTRRPSGTLALRVGASLDRALLVQLFTHVGGGGRL